ncbi:MAG: hypothetical protein J7L89_07715 [Bacteroidales bacterium]|nr:hypothetical protein [Bacteroidales bacterium]
MKKSSLIFLLTALFLWPVRGYSLKHTDRKRKDIAIIVQFPEDPIAIPNYRSFWNTMAHLFDFNHDGYWPVGHTGVLLVEAASGHVEYFDMGRYDDRNDLTGPRSDFYGVVRSARHVPSLRIKLQAKIVNGWVENMDEILIHLGAKTLIKDYGRIEAAVVYRVDYQRMVRKARRLEDMGYIYYGAPTHLYCTSFVRKVVRKGGQPFPWLVFTGTQTIKHIRKSFR